MLEFLSSVIAVFTITLLIVIAFLYFKLYENKKDFVHVMLTIFFMFTNFCVYINKRFFVYSITITHRNERIL